MEQVRIAILIATLPGLIFAIANMTEPNTTPLDKGITYSFTLGWGILFIVHLIS